MLPEFIKHALIQELPKAELDRLIRKSGFDPDNLIPTLPRDLLFELTYRGELDFNLTVGAFGESHMLPCRTVWTAELTDDAETQQRVVSQVHCTAHVLVRSEEEDHLEWSILDFNLLPRSAVEAMDARIEEQARLQELAEKSNR